jgi:hypothetical protein
VVDDDEREMPFELEKRLSYRLDQIAVVVMLDQVRDRLGVGLRREGVPFSGQPLA